MRMKNIVLIGPSGAGKTSIGKYISNILKIEHIDTDDLVKKQFNMSIEKIFYNYGEDCFRMEEANIVKKIADRDNLVISTGGGVVINKDNIRYLRKNGILFLLTGNIDTLTQNLMSSREQRPLIGCNNIYGNIHDKIKNIFLQRKDLYINSADYFINIDNRTIEEIGEEIIWIYEKY